VDGKLENQALLSVVENSTAIEFYAVRISSGQTTTVNLCNRLPVCLSVNQVSKSSATTELDAIIVSQ